jgi:hypothetical protein
MIVIYSDFVTEGYYTLHGVRRQTECFMNSLFYDARYIAIRSLAARQFSPLCRRLPRRFTPSDV